MPDSLRTETPATTTIPTPAGATSTTTMKANGKEKIPIVAPTDTAAEQDQSLEASNKQSDQAKAKDSSIASTVDSEASADDLKDSATTHSTTDQDEEMKEASPITTDVIEEDTPMAEPALVVKPRDLPGIPEGIDQEDLDGGLLDGALDDYDDLDQDTEDTEVGNGDDDFSDDDDDDDDLDGPLLNSTDKTNHDSDTHTPGAMSHADTAKSEDPDSDDEMDQDERDEALQTEDSDSDLGDLDASDNDQDDDDEDEDEGDADGEDADDDEEEEEEEIKPPVKKDTVLSQKPTLHRPSITEEELKDSGDELSDLSEFDDTDDSDEDDDIPEPKPVAKEPASAPLAPPAPVSTEKAGSAAASTTGPAPPTTTTKPTLGGRKRSLHETTVEPVKPEDESIKSEQEDQAEIPIPSGRARLSEPGSRKRRVSEAEDTQPSDKESESEVAEEEDETEKLAKEEDEDEGEEDHEMKQLHKDALDALTSIEIEFANLRDKMYEERMAELDREVEMINDGTHPELSSFMQEIEQKREHRLHIADMGRKYKSDIAQSALDVTEYQAHCTFQSARRNIRTQMVHDMGKKQRQLILELTLSPDGRKRKLTTAVPEKAVLVRARKHKRVEVNELKAISEKRGFPTSSKLSTVTQAELQDDFALMGLTRLLPQPKTAGIDPQTHVQTQALPQMQPQRHGGPLPPSIPISTGPSSSRHNSNSRWPSVNDYPPPPNMPPTGSYYGARNDVEIYVDGSRCMVDGIWYKPNDAVVVLDAAIGKYNAKYVTLEADWIVLQRTDGSKTRLHLGLFRGRKLCMQPKA